MSPEEREIAAVHALLDQLGAPSGPAGGPQLGAAIRVRGLYENQAEDWQVWEDVFIDHLASQGVPEPAVIEARGYAEVRVLRRLKTRGGW